MTQREREKERTGRVGELERKREGEIEREREMGESARTGEWEKVDKLRGSWSEIEAERKREKWKEKEGECTHGTVWML